jgi:hypothetical protein
MVNKNFEMRVGSRAQVFHGTAKQTSGGLRRSDLKKNKRGAIVSRRASARAKKENRLIKAGFITKKGKFGVVQRGGDISVSYQGSTYDAVSLEKINSVTVLKMEKRNGGDIIYLVEKQADIDTIEESMKDDTKKKVVLISNVEHVDTHNKITRSITELSKPANNIKLGFGKYAEIYRLIDKLISKGITSNILRTLDKDALVKLDVDGKDVNAMINAFSSM